MDSHIRPDVLLFGESAARIIVSAKPEDADAVISIARELGAPVKRIGTVGGRLISIKDILSVDLAELHAHWSGAMKEMMGE